MELISNLVTGFTVASTQLNLAYAFIGCFLGTLIGVLPGIGPLTTIAMLIPVTYGLPPITAMIMLAGIYYGAQYGGSTTAILVNIPGDASSVVTTIDGYKMALRGRAGAALIAAGVGSFFAGCVSTLLIALFATPLSAMAYTFGPAEYCSLMAAGLLGALSLNTSTSKLTAIGMVLVGILLGTIGTDVTTGVTRFANGVPELSDGIGFVVISMGIFGFAEIISRLSGDLTTSESSITPVGKLLISKNEVKNMIPAILRGTGIGSLLGMMPGGGAIIAAFSAYSFEKRMGVTHDELPFGEGNIRGVAAPESANNAAAQTSYIPLLALGIPDNAVMALMIGSMISHGIQPGPLVMIHNPDLFWGLIVSMWIGNAMLIILNLPLVGLWVKLLSIPYRLLFPAIIVFCAFGIYSINNSIVDILLAGLFGIIGYVFITLRMETAPLLMGFVLGPLLEENLRRTLLMSRGDWSVFLTRPISAGLLTFICLVMLWSLYSNMDGNRGTLQS